MKVTNNHHFSQGVLLEIQDGKLKWTVDQTSQRHKYGTIRIEKGDGVVALDPLESPDSFVRLLNIAFEFTGCVYHGLRIQRENQAEDIDETSTAEQQRVIDLIYRTPLERKVRLVYFDYECDCGMPGCWGGCGDVKVVDLKMEPIATTYGELFKSLGRETVTEDGITHYEYPDSVWLVIEALVGTHRGLAAVKTTEEFDEGTTYIRFHYCR